MAKRGNNDNANAAAANLGFETRYRYSNTLGWNTFPVPALTEQNKDDLTRCAEDILLAREAHSPATIADMYNPGNADSGNADGDGGYDPGKCNVGVNPETGLIQLEIKGLACPSLPCLVRVLATSEGPANT